jgi:hypothetical protein
MSAKDEAIRAVTQIRDTLQSREALVFDQLQLRLILAMAEHALEQISAIQEVRRIRKPRMIVG